MQKGIYILIILCIAASSRHAIAQDFHLTQYDASPLYLNPALTGQFMENEADYRAHLNYRSQWGSITPNSFTTAMFGFDSKYKERWGVGGYVVSDRAGVANYGTINFMLSGSYEVSQDPNKIHNLLVGTQLGIIHKSFNPDQLNFDNQYSSTTGGFDQGLSSREVFEKTSLFGFDANIGVFYKYKDPDKRAHPFLGLSLLHLPRPNESFTTEKNKVPIRSTLHGGADLIINEQFLLTSGLLFMKQGIAQEINVNVLGSYHLQDSDVKILLGAGYRLKDAILLQTGVDYKNSTLRMSYDITTSYLSTYSRGRGGFEISLIYRAIKGEEWEILRFH